jgi:hypothetical protein
MKMLINALQISVTRSVTVVGPRHKESLNLYVTLHELIVAVPVFTRMIETFCFLFDAHLFEMSRVDLAGQRFGRWQVLELAPTRYQDRWPQWLCLCACDRGVIRAVRTSELRLGKSKSCGCVSAEKARARSYARLQDLTGRRFGRLVVIAFAGRKADSMSEMTHTEHRETKRLRPVWRCRCDCGDERIIRQECLLRGHTISCGCYQKEKMRMLQRSAHAALKILTSTQLLQR